MWCGSPLCTYGPRCVLASKGFIEGGDACRIVMLIKFSGDFIFASSSPIRYDFDRLMIVTEAILGSMM